MNINTFRHSLYLASLLEHIPTKEVQKAFELILEQSGEEAKIKRILNLADDYASANHKSSLHKEWVQSPFEGLKKDLSSAEYVLPHKELTLARENFPVKRNDAKNDIKKLWSLFTEEFMHMNLSEDIAKSEYILSLLHKYTTSIPAVYGLNAEVSWFDYAKSKAGLAVALFDYMQEKGVDKIENGDEPLALIRADISGIQNFIGNISGSKAAKNLKGRSFYIQLLSDTVLQLMLDDLDLFEGNVMYASGGNFFVIAPNISKVQAAFNADNNSSFEAKITRAIFEQHKTNIAVVMGWQPLSQQEVFAGEIDGAIKKLFEEKIDVKKKQKFLSLIQTDYDAFFTVEKVDAGGDTMTDCMTGEEIGAIDEMAGGRIYELDEKEPYPQLRKKKNVKNALKKSTAKQIFIGGQLKETIKIAISREPLDLGGDNHLREKVEVCPFPNLESTLYYYLVSKKNAKKILATGKVEKVISINDFRVDERGRSFALYGGNEFPLNDGGKVKSYEELAGEKSEEDGEETKEKNKFKRLGVLRMDIDGLGTIFKESVPRPSYRVNMSASEVEKLPRRKGLNFAFYAAVSRNLDWFFKGYLNTIWDKEKYRNHTQIVYSGGDDLFLVGRWDLILEFAEEIKVELADFVCSEGLKQEERISISGGVSIVTSKFPVIKASELAGKAEKQAKQHAVKDVKETIAEKNSICFFNKPLHWDSEYELVKALRDDLLDLIKDKKDESKKGGLPRSIFSKINIHYQMMMVYKNSAQENKSNKNPKWIWIAAYDFSRMASRLKDNYRAYIHKLKSRSDEGSKMLLDRVIAKKEKDTKKVELLKNALFTNRYETENNQKFEVKSNYHFLELLHLAARWAELTLRNRS